MSERKRATGTELFVAYCGDEVLGVFDAIEKAAAAMGVSVGTAKWYMTPSALRKPTCIERVICKWA